MKKVETEATAWSWVCPDEACEHGNNTDRSDIDFGNDPPWTATCKGCGREVELNLN